MTDLRQWFFSQHYTSVKFAELAEPLPNGGHLRGIRLTRHIWVGRDMKLYRLDPTTREVTLLPDEVLDTIPSATVVAQWQRAIARHERRRGEAKARRRRVVQSRSLTAP